MTPMEGMLITAIAALAAAVVAVWKKGDVAERRCDEDRKLLWEAVLATQKKTCSVENCFERTPCQSPTLGQLLERKKEREKVKNLQRAIDSSEK